MLWQAISRDDAFAEPAEECLCADLPGAARGIVAGLIISFPLWCLITLVILQLL